MQSTFPISRHELELRLGISKLPDLVKESLLLRSMSLISDRLLMRISESISKPLFQEMVRVVNLGMWDLTKVWLVERFPKFQTLLQEEIDFARRGIIEATK